MRWFEYKMELDGVQAPDELKARLRALRPEAAPAPKTPPARKKRIRFPLRRLGAAAACLALLVGLGQWSGRRNQMEGIVASPMVYRAADSMSMKAAALGGSNGVMSLSAESTPEEAALTADRKIIYTADLGLESLDYEAARAALEEAVRSAGGYLESSCEYRTDGDQRYCSLTARIPQTAYADFLGRASDLANVRSRSESARDVTADYLDVEAHLDNLRTERDTLRQMLDRAENLSDLLEIRSQLSEVQSKLDSWEGQQRWYDSRIDYCTVTLSLQEVSSLTVTGGGFAERLAEALAGGWGSFVEGVAAGLLALAGLWPAAVLVAVACAVGAVWFRRRKK